MVVVFWGFKLHYMSSCGLRRVYTYNEFTTRINR
jgi:hypothetical protein